MKKILNQLAPFILAGISIVALAFGIMLLFYLFLFGAIMGFILFALSWLKQQFFSKKPKSPTNQRKAQGRVIDVDNWRKL